MAKDQFYICNEKGRVIQIRRKVMDRYLIEYSNSLHDHSFAYVSEEEFKTIPPNTKKVAFD
jgi:hypothetical protein